MSVTIDIPDNILHTIKLPQSQIKNKLTQEIAFTLYERKLTSMGNARELANLSKWEFIEGLAERGIQVHYDEHEMNEDITYAKQHC